MFLLHDMPSNIYVQMQNPGCSVMVDNCYGEFVESIEAPMVVSDNVTHFCGTLFLGCSAVSHCTLVGRVQI